MNYITELARYVQDARNYAQNTFKQIFLSEKPSRLEIIAEQQIIRKQIINNMVE